MRLDQGIEMKKKGENGLQMKVQLWGLERINMKMEEEEEDMNMNMNPMLDLFLCLCDIFVFVSMFLPTYVDTNIVLFLSSKFSGIKTKTNIIIYLFFLNQI